MFVLTVKNEAGEIAVKKEFESASFVIGRDPDCDVSISSSGISRKHARIFTQDQCCFIEDLGSSNGTLVDGQKVHGQRNLGTASQIQIGEHLLFFHQSNAKFDISGTLFISDDDQHCKIVRVNDSFAGEVYNLSEMNNTIGRTDENFILLSDHSISRHHAEIHRTGLVYTLSDLQSSNGTQVNGRKIKKPVELRRGDKIDFGNLQFVFTTGGDQVPLHDDRTKSSNVSLPILAGAIVLVMMILGGAYVLLG